MRKRDLTGRRFGRLVVQGRADGVQRWACLCDCGAVTNPKDGALIRGATKSCGCLRRELRAAANVTHGRSRTPEHTIWASMVGRCRNTGHTSYPNYGGRGIDVDERWLWFENFFADMGPRPSPKHSIERIDNDANYSPYNCRWATRKEQHRNTRRNLLLTCAGRTQPAIDWAVELGINYDALLSRIGRGRSAAEALGILPVLEQAGEV